VRRLALASRTISVPDPPEVKLSAGGLWWFEDRGSVMEPQSGFLVSSAIWLSSPAMASFLVRRSSLKTFRVGSIRFSFMGCS